MHKLRRRTDEGKILLSDDMSKGVSVSRLAQAKPAFLQKALNTDPAVSRKETRLGRKKISGMAVKYNWVHSSKNVWRENPAQSV